MKGSTCLLVASLIVCIYAAPFETSGWRGLRRHREERGSDTKEVYIVDELLDSLDSTDIETLRLLLSKWDVKNDDGTDDNDFDEKKCRKCYNPRRTFTDVHSSESSESSDNSASSSSEESESEQSKHRKKKSRSHKRRNKSTRHRDANESESDVNRLKELIQKVQQKREQSKQNKNFNGNGKRNSSLTDLYEKLHRLVKIENRQYWKNVDRKKQNLIHKLNERRQKLLRACDITEDNFDKRDWIKQSARDQKCLIELVILKIKEEVIGSGTWSSNDNNGSGSRNNGLDNGNNSSGSDSNDSGSDTNESGNGSNDTGNDSNDSGSDSNDSDSDSNDSGSDTNESGNGSNDSGNDSNDSGSDSNDSDSDSNDSGSDTNESGNDSNDSGNDSNDSGSDSNDSSSDSNESSSDSNESGNDSNGLSNGNKWTAKGHNRSGRGNNGPSNGNNSSSKGNHGSSNNNKGSGIGGRVPGSVNGSSGNSHTTETTPQPEGATPGSDANELGDNNSSPKNSTNKSDSKVGNSDSDRGNLLNLEVGILVAIILQRNAEYNNNSTHNSAAWLELNLPIDLDLDLELDSENDISQNESSNSSSNSLLYLNIEVLLCTVLGINNAACNNSTNKSESLFGLKLPIDLDLDLGLDSEDDESQNGSSNNSSNNVLDVNIKVILCTILGINNGACNNSTNKSVSLLGLKLPVDLDLDLGLGSGEGNSLNGTLNVDGDNLLDLEVGILVGIILQKIVEYNNNSIHNSAALLGLKLPINLDLDLGLDSEDDISQSAYSNSSSDSLLYLNIEVLLCTVLGINNAACNNSTNKSESLFGLKLPIDLDLYLGLESENEESQKGSWNSSSGNILDVDIKVILCTILGINNAACKNSINNSGSLVDLKLPVDLDLDLGLGSDEDNSLNGTSNNKGDNSLDLEHGTLIDIISEINEEFNNNSTNIPEPLPGLKLPVDLDLDLKLRSDGDNSLNGTSDNNGDNSLLPVDLDLDLELRSDGGNSLNGTSDNNGDNSLDLEDGTLVSIISEINEEFQNNSTNISEPLPGLKLPVDVDLDLELRSDGGNSLNGTSDNNGDNSLDLEDGTLVGIISEINEEFQNNSTNISEPLPGLKLPVDVDLDLELRSDGGNSLNGTSDNNGDNSLDLEDGTLVGIISEINEEFQNNSTNISEPLPGLKLPVDVDLDLELRSDGGNSLNGTSDNNGDNSLDLEDGTLVGIISEINEEFQNNSTNISEPLPGLKLPVDVDLDLELRSDGGNSLNGTSDNNGDNSLDLEDGTLVGIISEINEEFQNNSTNISDPLPGLKLPVDLDLDLELRSDGGNSLNGTSDNNGDNSLDLEDGTLVGIISEINEEFQNNSTNISEPLPGLKLPMDVDLDLELRSDGGNLLNGTSDNNGDNSIDLEDGTLVGIISEINEEFHNNSTNIPEPLPELKLPVDLDLDLELRSDEGKSLNGTSDNNGDNSLVGIISEINEEFHNNSTNISEPLPGLKLPMDLDLDLGLGSEVDESQNGSSNSSSDDILNLNINVLVCTILGINNTACNKYTNKSGSLYGLNIPVDLGLDLGFSSNEEMSQNGTSDNRVDHLVDLEVGVLVGTLLQRNEECHNKSTNISAALLGLQLPIDLDLDLDFGSESNMSQNETSDSSSANLLELDVEVLLCRILGINRAPCNNSAKESGSLYGFNLPVDLDLDLGLGSNEEMSQHETSENGGGTLVDLEVGILIGIILQRNQEYNNNSTHNSAALLGLKLPNDLDLDLGWISDDFESQNGSWSSSRGKVLDLNIAAFLCTVLGINNATCKNSTNISELLLGVKLPVGLDLDLGLGSDEDNSLNGTSDNNGGSLLDLEVGILLGSILQRNEEYHSNSTHKSGSLLGLKFPTDLVPDLDLGSNDDMSQNETSDSSSANLLELDVEVLLCRILGINRAPCNNSAKESGSLFGFNLPVDLDLDLGLGSNEEMSQHETSENGGGTLVDLEVGILIGIILQRNQEYNNNSTHNSAALLGLKLPNDLDLDLGWISDDFESQNGSWSSSRGKVLDLNIAAFLCTVLGINNATCKNSTNISELLLGVKLPVGLDLDLGLGSDEDNSLNGTSDNNGGSLLDLEVGILLGSILQRNEEYHSNSTHKSGSLLGLKFPTDLVPDLDLGSNDDMSQNETSDSSGGNLLELDVEVLLCTILGINNVVCKNFTNISGSLFGLKLPVDLDLALGLASNEDMSQNGTWDNDRGNLLNLEVGILIGIILERNEEYRNNFIHKSGSLLGLTVPIDLDLELGWGSRDDKSQNETLDSSLGNLLYLDVEMDEEDKSRTETNEMIHGGLVGQEVVGELDIILYQNTDCSNSTENCDFENGLIVSRELDV